MAWYKPWTWADQSEGQKEQTKEIRQQGLAGSNFADQGEAGFGATGAEAAESRGLLRDLAMGKNSLSAEQLRQGLQQQLGMQQSMAAGAAPGSQAMAARNAMNNAGRASSAMAGNAAMAGIAERAAAQKAWAEAILGARGQDLQAALGSRQNAIAAYGGYKPEGSFLDKWGNAITTAAGFGAGGGGGK